LEGEPKAKKNHPENAIEKGWPERRATRQKEVLAQSKKSVEHI